MIADKKIINVNEAAARMNCTPGRICQLLRAGAFDGVKLNERAWAIFSDSFEKFLNDPQTVRRKHYAN